MASRGSFSTYKAAPKTRCKPRPPLGVQKWPPNRFRSTPGTLRGRKKSLGTSKSALGEILSEISSKNKPGDHGTGSAFEARAASKASETRARRSQRTLQAETAKKHQEEQEPPRAGQQEHRDSEPGHATVASRRRCAPPPRRLELGAFPGSFPAVSSRLSGSIGEKPWENYGPQRREETKETKANQEEQQREQPPRQPLVYFKIASKTLQKKFKNRAKMAPNSFPRASRRRKKTRSAT